MLEFLLTLQKLKMKIKSNQFLEEESNIGNLFYKKFYSIKLTPLSIINLMKFYLTNFLMRRFFSFMSSSRHRPGTTVPRATTARTESGTKIPTRVRVTKCASSASGVSLSAPRKFETMKKKLKSQAKVARISENDPPCRVAFWVVFNFYCFTFSKFKGCGVATPAIPV